MTNESIKWHPSSHPPQNFQLIRFDFATSFPPSLPAPSSHDILCDSQPIKRVLNYSIGSFSIQGFFSIARDYFQLLMAGGISSHRLCITSDQIDTSVLHQDSSPERKGRKGGGGRKTLRDSLRLDPSSATTGRRGIYSRLRSSFDDSVRYVENTTKSPQRCSLGRRPRVRQRSLSLLISIRFA